MNIDEAIKEIRSVQALLDTLKSSTSKPINDAPVFDNPVVAQFIGRFIFLCHLEIKGNYCYLTKVRNIRYWDARANGLADLANKGPNTNDKIDLWPDQIIPLDKLGPVMCANKEIWS